MKTRTGFLTGLGLAVVAIVLTMAPAAASHVTPVYVGGNPTCTDLGYGFGFKLDPPNPGTYAIGGLGTVTIASDGTYFDWTSTVGVDAVIVKGGPNANVYAYDPPAEAFGDTGLHSPVNPNDHHPYELIYGLSHIDFCFDYELEVTKTADASRTRTFGWTIEKSVAPDTWDLFTGDSGTSEYTVTLTKDDGTDGPWVVSGTITIGNNTPLEATIESVVDTLSGLGGVAVDCGVDFPYVLGSGGALECSYSSELPNNDSRTNTATVETSGPVAGGSATAAVVFSDVPTLINDSVTVDDTLKGELGTFDGDEVIHYQRKFVCDGDAGANDNTATIVETGQSASASVLVTCYPLTVTKDATADFDRSWTWTIDKSADQTDLVLSDGQVFPVNYEVVVNASATGSGGAVSGNITVHNPAPFDAILDSVSDVLSPDIGVTVECGVVFPYVLPAGGTLTCTYSATVPDGSGRVNTATATLQNHDYDPDGVGTAAGTTDFTGSAGVVGGNEVDECVEVSDTNLGVLGTVCGWDAPHTFSYTLWFGTDPGANVVLACGENGHQNTASFVTNDTGATGSDDWTVNANVACGQGCTLTQGYWKTHSEFGPAPYDDTWAQLPNGASTLFFLSGQTYHEVLWTEPEGNAYYILAHAYIAAQLNQLSGASMPPDVLAAFNQAATLLGSHTPSQIAAMAGDDPTRALFVSLAGTLDAYNNGLSGPGHCSE